MVSGVDYGFACLFLGIAEGVDEYISGDVEFAFIRIVVDEGDMSKEMSGGISEGGEVLVFILRRRRVIGLWFFDDAEDFLGEIHGIS